MTQGEGARVPRRAVVRRPGAPLRARACGFLSTTPDGVIVKANETYRTWIGLGTRRIGRRTFVDLLSRRVDLPRDPLRPALRMHDGVREIALDLVRGDGRRLPVLVNAELERDEAGRPPGREDRLRRHRATRVRAGSLRAPRARGFEERGASLPGPCSRP